MTRGPWAFAAISAAALAAALTGQALAQQQAAQDNAVVVEMTDQLKFQPNTVRVRVGQTVQWRNRSSYFHTVTADEQRAQIPAHVELPEDAEPFHSGDIPPGGEYSHTFKVPGTYRYTCVPHELSDMSGTVIVSP